jgi:hypothetical protein
VTGTRRLESNCGACRCGRIDFEIIMICHPAVVLFGITGRHRSRDNECDFEQSFGISACLTNPVKRGAGAVEWASDGGIIIPKFDAKILKFIWNSSRIIVDRTLKSKSAHQRSGLCISQACTFSLNMEIISRQ